MTESLTNAGTGYRYSSLANSTFVGRQREMAELKAVLEEALFQRAQLVLLVGEPGIGKTRTARELAGFAESRGVHVMWGRSQQDQGAPPYWPWTQMIRSYIQGQEPADLAAQMGTGAPDIAQLVPELRDYLGTLEPLQTMESPDHARFRLFDAITTFFRRACQKQPLMLVLDNLHWADRPSLLLLEFLAREVVDCPVLLMGTYRDTELTRRHPLALTLGELNREPWFRRMALRGLSQEEVSHFIQFVAGYTPPQDLAQAVHTQTEGNPLFMTQVVQLLAQEGSLVPGINPGSRGWDIRIPAGVQEAIGRQLDRLSEDCQHLLALASVVGREFDLRVLERLEGSASADALLELLEEAIAAHVIEEARQAVGHYQFTHVLIQSTLAREMSTTRQARLHLRIGQCLEELYAGNLPAHASQLAHHFSRAAPVGGLEKLVHYSMLAGEEALTTHAHEDALAYFQQGLEAREGQPMDSEMAALWFGLGRAQAATQDRFQFKEYLSSLRRAFDYYMEVGDVDQAVVVAEFPIRAAYGVKLGAADMISRALALVPPESRQAGRLLSNYSLEMYLESGDYSRAQEALDRALTIARQEGDAFLELRTLANATAVHFHHLNFSQCLKMGRQAIMLAGTVEDLRSRVVSGLHMTRALLYIGDREGAQDYGRQTLLAAEQLRDREWLSQSLWVNGTLSHYTGDWSAANAYLDRGLEVIPGDPRIICTRTVVEHELGNLQQGENYLERLLYNTRRSPMGAGFA